jgi:hypothetical protein
MQLSSPTISEIILPSPPETLVPDYRMGDGSMRLLSLSLSLAATFAISIDNSCLRELHTAKMSFLSSTDSPVIADSSVVS